MMKCLNHERGAGWPHTQAAMTLLEVVIALAITGVAVAGIINGYTYCTTSSQKAALTLAANARAVARIEETRSAKWDTSSYPVVDHLLTSNFPSKVVTLDLSGSGSGMTTATIHTDISQVSDNPPLKRIRVECIWLFNGIQSVTNTIETIRAPDQ